LDHQTQETLRAVEQIVTRLIEHCRKHGPLYPRNPRAVAHVSRTSKWLLNAINAMRSALTAPESDASKKS
jgi:hypothetical protein